MNADSFVNRLLSQKTTWTPYGNHKTYCNNRIILGPIQSWWWGLEIYTIAVTAVFFYEYDKNISQLITLVGGIGFLICIISSWKTILCDPGIFPRLSFEDALENATEADRMKKSGLPCPTKGVEVEGFVVKYTYCLQCHHFRPPMTGHCRICDSCIQGWDHHCPVFGGCVGKDNSIAFRIMAFSLPLYHTFLLLCGIIVLIIYVEKHGKQFYSNWWTVSFTLNVTIVGFVVSSIMSYVLIYVSFACDDDEPPLRPFNNWAQPFNQQSTLLNSQVSSPQSSRPTTGSRES